MAPSNDDPMPARTSGAEPGPLPRWARVAMILGWTIIALLFAGLLDRVFVGHRHLPGVDIERLTSEELRALPRALGFIGAYVVVAAIPLICGVVLRSRSRRAGTLLAVAAVVALAGWILTEAMPYGLFGAPPVIWTEYHSPAGDFVVSLPGTPEVRETTEETELGPVRMTTTELERGLGYFSVTREDHPEALFREQTLAEIYDADVSRIVEAFSADIVARSDLQMAGHDARATAFHLREREEPYYLEARIIVVDHRVYRILARRHNESEKQADADALRFFESFRLVGAEENGGAGDQ